MEAANIDDGPTITPSHTYPLLYSLPTEIIIQICSLAGPLLTSHISHWLREIVLGTGSLWSAISISDPNHLTILEPCLERSGECPLHLSIDLPAPHPGVENQAAFSAASAAAVLDIIIPHFSRIKYISLNRFQSHLDETIDNTAVQTVLAPQLEVLILILPSDSNTILSRFSLHCPNLKVAQLYGASALQFDQYIGEAKNLLILHISPFNAFDRPAPVLDIYPIIVKNADSLASLTLRDMRVAPQDVPQHKVVLKTLKKVTVCDFAIIPIFNTITAPQLEIIHIQLNSRHEVHDARAPLFAAIIDFIARHSSLLEYLIISKDEVEGIPSLWLPHPLPILPRLRRLRIQGDIQLSSFGSLGSGLEAVDVWTSDLVTHWGSLLSFVEPTSASLQYLRLKIERHVNSIDTTLFLSFPKLEALILHGIGSDLFLTQISSMPCLRELKIQFMTYPAPEPDENIIPYERGTLVLPALVQLDIPYLPHALLYLSTPKLEILRLNLLSVRSRQAEEIISTFLSRCGSQLTELHIRGYDTYRHPPMSLPTVEPVAFPNLQALYQSLPSCITPIVNIIAPSLDHLTIRFDHATRAFEESDTFWLPNGSYLSQIRHLTIPSHPDTRFSDVLWTLNQVETLQIQVEETTQWSLAHNAGLPSKYHSLFLALGDPGDAELPSLPFPKLQHLRMRVGGTRIVLPFSFIKRLILARLGGGAATPLTQFTLEFEGDHSLPNISYAYWAKQRTFNVDWLSETDWEWTSANVPEFRCHLIRRYSIPELGHGTRSTITNIMHMFGSRVY